MNDTMLTTIDNPFDPFTQFDEWKRFAKTSDELSETDEAIAINQAIDEIINLNILGIYRKVVA